MPPLDVRMTHVMHLEAERVLQVVVRLFGRKARHHGRALRDVYDHQSMRLGQGAGTSRSRSGDGTWGAPAHSSS